MDLRRPRVYRRSNVGLVKLEDISFLNTPGGFDCGDCDSLNMHIVDPLIMFDIPTFLRSHDFVFSCDQAALRTLISVRPSVLHTFLTMFLSSYHPEIFRSFHHICNIKCRLDCRYSSQNIFNAKNFNPHKKLISFLNVPIYNHGMQQTWWPEASTIIVTRPYYNSSLPALCEGNSSVVGHVMMSSCKVQLTVYKFQCLQEF